mmetsp:Transcript_38535/g.89167  ORF Transcript_38535/g.89167 Transcript_38535/m.89167 type:complete len:288 (+) Transcript_38535:1005-1868(+)
MAQRVACRAVVGHALRLGARGLRHAAVHAATSQGRSHAAAASSATLARAADAQPKPRTTATASALAAELGPVLLRCPLSRRGARASPATRLLRLRLFHLLRAEFAHGGERRRHARVRPLLAHEQSVAKPHAAASRIEVRVEVAPRAEVKGATVGCERTRECTHAARTDGVVREVEVAQEARGAERGGGGGGALVAELVVRRVHRRHMLVAAQRSEEERTVAARQPGVRHAHLRVPRAYAPQICRDARERGGGVGQQPLAQRLPPLAAYGRTHQPQLPQCAVGAQPAC